MYDIRFRAWIPSQKIMVKFDLTSCCIGNGALGWGEFQEANIMQCTGLLDRNDKEIYEGDIIKEHWMEKDIIFNVEDWYKVLYWNFGYSGKTWEIIGNIWENPELLTK